MRKTPFEKHGEVARRHKMMTRKWWIPFLVAAVLFLVAATEARQLISVLVAASMSTTSVARPVYSSSLAETAARQVAVATFSGPVRPGSPPVSKRAVNNGTPVAAAVSKMPDQLDNGPVREAYGK